MGKTRGDDYAGTREKAGFVRLEQEDPYGCGAACLRMIELWATGKCRSEMDWWTDAKMVKEKGIGPRKMKSALKSMNLELKQWEVGDSVPDDLSTVNVLYLLCTSSYGVDGVDYGHWIVMFDLLQEHKKLQLVVCADPLYRAMVVTPWKCLREHKVLKAYRIERPPR